MALLKTNTGIGTTNPTSALHVIGDVLVTGVVTATTFSGNINAGVSTIGVATATNLTARQLNVSGLSTFTGITTSQSTIFATQLSVSGVSTFNNNVRLPDNKTLSLGDSDDLQLIHDGNDSFIKDTGTGSLIINTNKLEVKNAANTETGIVFTQDNSVELYYDNIKKFETTSAGIALTNGASDIFTISGPQNIIIDPDPVGVATTSGIVRIKGDLYVDGTQFVVNSGTIELADLKVGIATTVGTNLLLDGGGIGIGSANIEKTFLYNFLSDSLKSSENLDLASGKVYKINGTEVLSASQLTVANIFASGITTIGIASLSQLFVTGISTFTGAIDANGGATIDNIQIGVTDNNEIDTVTGNLTIDSADGTVTIDDQLIVSGVTTFTDTTANTLKNVNTGSVQLDGGAGIAGNVSIGGGLNVNNVTTSTGGFLIDVNGGGSLYRLADGAFTAGIGYTDNTGLLSISNWSDVVIRVSDTETAARFNNDGSVELYYDNSKKFETLGVGATVTGTLFSNQLSVSGLSTFIGIVTTGGDLFVGGDLYVRDDLVFDEFTARNANITGVGTVAVLISPNGTITNLIGTAATITSINVNNANIVTGVVTTLSGSSATYTTGNFTVANIQSGIVTDLNVPSKANISVGLVTTLQALSGVVTDLNVPSRANIQSGIITTLNVTTGNINTGVVTTLSGSSATYTTGNFTTGNINTGVVTTLSGSSATYTTGNFTVANAQSGIVTTLNVPSRANIQSGIITTLNVTTGNINTGVITTLSGSSATYTTGNFTVANAQSGIVTDLNVPSRANIQSGIITTLNVTTGNINTGIITTLSGSSATYTTGNFTTGNIVTGVVTTLSGSSATYTTGNFNALNAQSGIVTDLNVPSRANIQSGIITTLNVTTGNINTGVITTLSGSSATYTTGNFTTGNIVTGVITTLTSTNSTLTNINSTGISTFNNTNATHLRVSGVTTSVGGFVGNLTGTATTATKLETARTFQITGDIVASPISFDGTGNVSLAATIQPNSVALGSDTTGDYVQSISGTANQITVTGGTGESSTPTISITNNPTLPGNVTIGNDLQVNSNLNVSGNITIGGTSAYITADDFRVRDADIVLGFTTNILNQDVSNDTTANHGGIAIASTEGNPLVQLFIAGIETNPATYKKIMWFKAGSFAGLGTDAWLSNYAVGIGSTQFPNETRLAAGSVQFNENDLTVVRNINASGIVTASTANITTLNATTGNINTGVVTTLSGSSATYTTGNFSVLNAQSGIVTNFNVPSRANIQSGIVTDLNVPSRANIQSGIITTLNVTTGNINIGIVTTLTSTNATLTNINSSGISTLGVTSVTNLTAQNINNSGITTTNSLNIDATQVISSSRQLQNIASLDATTTATIEAAIANAPNTFTDLQVTGITTLGITSATDLTVQQLSVSGLSTFAGITTVTGTTLFAKQLNVSGVTTTNRISVTGLSTDNIDYGGAQKLLRAVGDGTWEWASVPGIFSVNNILNGFNVSEEGSIVGTAGSIIQLDFRGNNITASAAPQPNGIATIRVSDTPNFDSLSVSGLSTFAGITTVTGTTLFAKQLNVSGVSTFIGLGTFIGDLFVGGNLFVQNDLVFDEFTARNINVTGIGTFNQFNSTGISTVTTLSGSSATYTTANFTVANAQSGIVTDLNVPSRANIQSGIITTLNSTTANINTGVITTLSGSSVTYTTGNFEAGNINAGVVTTLSGSSATYDTGNFTTGNINTGVVTTLSGSTATYTTVNATNVNATGVITGSQLITGSGAGLTLTSNTIFGPSVIFIDPSPVGVATTSGAVRILGDLYVDGTQFVVNSTTIELGDFNVGIATTVGTNLLLDGAGIGIGSENIRKTLTYSFGSDSLKSSENLDLASGKVYKINGTEILSSSQLTIGTGNLNLLNASTGVVTTLSGSSATYTTGNFNIINVQSGIITTLNATTGNINVGIITNLSGTNANFSGVITATTFVGTFTGTATTAITATNVIGGIGSITQLNVSGVTTTGTLNVGVGGTIIATTGIGSVGIGSTLPKHTLDVNGSINFNGGLFQNGSRFTSGIGIGSTAVNPQSGFVNQRIGIGFTDLNIVGTGISVTGYGSTVVIDFGNIAAGSGGALSISTITNPRIQNIAFVGTANTSIIGISTITDRFVYDTQTGSVGIGTSGSSTPAFKLDVVGDINSSTSVKIKGIDVLEEAVRLAIAFG